jgi:hypothetical protein
LTSQYSSSFHMFLTGSFPWGHRLCSLDPIPLSSVALSLHSLILKIQSVYTCFEGIVSWEITHWKSVWHSS